MPAGARRRSRRPRSSAPSARGARRPRRAGPCSRRSPPSGSRAARGPAPSWPGRRPRRSPTDAQAGAPPGRRGSSPPGARDPDARVCRGPPAAGTVGAMIHVDAAPGVHRIEDDSTNWYLLEGDDGLTIVDAGVPRSWQSLQDALKRLGRGEGDIRALVLTHAHFDHVGFAERARSRLGIPVYVHEDDVPLTRHPWRYDYERTPIRYFATQIDALPIVARFVRDR